MSGWESVVPRNWLDGSVPALPARDQPEPAAKNEAFYTGGIRIKTIEPLMKQIMDWAKAQGATRSEAIRRLVELGLKAKAGK